MELDELTLWAGFSNTYPATGTWSWCPSWELTSPTTVWSQWEGPRRASTILHALFSGVPVCKRNKPTTAGHSDVLNCHHLDKHINPGHPQALASGIVDKTKVGHRVSVCGNAEQTSFHSVSVSLPFSYSFDKYEPAVC